MIEPQTLSYHPGPPLTIYCAQCGQAMCIAPQHRHLVVACPHCQQPVEPWRIPGADARQAGHSTPPPNAFQSSTAVSLCSWRNRWIAGALGVLLGGLGVHRFYLGFSGVGLLQVLLSVLSIGMLYPIIAIWGFIEGILCFCGAMRDAEGLPLSG